MARKPVQNKQHTPDPEAQTTVAPDPDAERSHLDRCSSCHHPFAPGKWTACDTECTHRGPIKIGRHVIETLTADIGNAGKLSAGKPGEVFASGRNKPSSEPSDICELCLRRSA